MTKESINNTHSLYSPNESLAIEAFAFIILVSAV